MGVSWSGGPFFVTKSIYGGAFTSSVSLVLFGVGVPLWLFSFLPGNPTAVVFPFSAGQFVLSEYPLGLSLVDSLSTIMFIPIFEVAGG